MKKYLNTILLTLLLTVTIISCKKDSATDQKDYAASIKDKIWWGTLTNAGENAQYYSVHFKANGSLIWSQMAGDYAGKWVVNGKQLTIDFPALAVQVKFDISDDNSLTNITTNTVNTVNTAELIVNPDIPLENTSWRGTMPTSGGTLIFGLRFKTGTQAILKGGGPEDVEISYTRSVNGAFIRFKTGVSNYFGVIKSDNEIKGSIDKTYDTWQVTKQ